MLGCRVQVIWPNSRILSQIGELVDITNDWWTVRFEDGSEHEYLPEHFQFIPDVKEDLAAKVKIFQFEFPFMRSRWAEHCQKQGGNARDPCKHGMDSLQLFLSVHSIACRKCKENNVSDNSFCGQCGDRFRKN